MIIRRVMAISNRDTLLGGGEWSFLELIGHLNRHWQPLAVLPGTGALGEMLGRLLVPTVTVPLAPIRPWRLPAMAATLRRLAAACRMMKADVIYANGSRAAFYAGLVAQRYRLPAVWHCRIAAADPRLDPILCRLCKRIVANSRATAERFRGRFRPNVVVVHNGIDLSRFEPSAIPLPEGIPDNRQVLLHVAQISRGKGHDLALAAFNIIAARHPLAHLVFVGGPDPHDSAWADHLRTMAGRSAAGKRIHWLGAIDDVRPWYRAASLLFFPAVNEAFGRVVVEAMAVGVPVVACRSGGVAEIIRDEREGCLFPEGDVAGAVDHIDRLLSDGTLREALVASGMRRAADFSLVHHVAAITRVLDETVGCAGVRDERPETGP